MDNPDLVLGKRVLDFGAGSGLVALAAAKAGARHVIAADIDSFAVAAISRNAKANALAVETVDKDMIGSRERFDLILIGDMCYERPLAERLMAWLKETQADILLGDPGRSYFPKSGLTRLATYNVPTTRELEDREIRETSVWRLDRA
jgi:predicted nicotinamide N-methyase